MRALVAPLFLFTAPLATACPQTEAISSFGHPDGSFPGWGTALVPVGDLDGDGASDLAVGALRHGGGEAATVHSGRTGELLFRLHAPVVPMFLGDAIVPLADETGDSLPELALIGSHSGDPNSPPGMFLVYSGADGSLLRTLTLSSILPAHSQARSFSPGDIDGDGSDDLLCRTAPAALTLFSSQTAQPLYRIVPPAPGTLVPGMLTRLGDRDRDGWDDIAVVVRESGSARVEIRSGLSGRWLGEFSDPGLDVLTGNGEPILEVADLDGDGLGELATGAVFNGRVTLYSIAKGGPIRSWSCTSAPSACLGSRLIELGDFSGDGHPDLVALESNAFGSGGLRLYGLDPLLRAPLFPRARPSARP